MQSTEKKYQSQLIDFAQEHKKIGMTIWVKVDGFFKEAELAFLMRTDPQSGEETQYVHVYLRGAPGTYDGQHYRVPDMRSAFEKFAEILAGSEPLIDSLVVTAGPELDSANPLYEICRGAWCEVWESDASRVVKKHDPHKFRKEELRKFFLSLLEQGESGIKTWNSRSQAERKLTSFKATDLHDMSLFGIDLRELDFKESNFNNVRMQSADLRSCDVKKSTFIGADLSNANLYALEADNANFTDARMAGCRLMGAKFQKAIFTRANLAGAQLANADLRGANLSTCDLTDALLASAVYDETTLLPGQVTQWPGLKYKGSGPDPYKQAQKQAATAIGPVDFPGFIGHLQSNFDKSRLDKALSMLKKDTFQLFCEVGDEAVTGIVKSQTDSELVYSCRLSADGAFGCCTQNLNACGGLRGALCKHILVLVIGLTKAEQLAPTTAAQWVLSSKVEKPNLDKDRMSEVFLKYKGAEAGEIDWRPTETIPEDYYSF